MGRLEVELSLLHSVDHLLTQRERRLGPEDVHLQNSKPVIRPRKDLVIERHHDEREHERAGQRRQKELSQRYAPRLERRDLVLGRQPTERVEDGDEHGHGQCHRDRERDRQQEKLQDHLPGQTLADKVTKAARDVLKKHQRRQRGERERERSDMLLEDVLADYLHERSGSCAARNFKISTGLYGDAWTEKSTGPPCDRKVRQRPRAERPDRRRSN